MVKNEVKKVRRTCWDSLVSELDKPEISILLGPRQVGKTYLLRELQKYAESELGKHTRYYNLEIPADLISFQKSDAELFNKLTQPDHEVVFIDEFHYLPNASKLFKAIFDSDKKVKLVVSGSSSIEIHKHLKESLAGRRHVTRISPLSFDEYCLGFPEASRQTLLSDYLTFGGLPGLIHLSEESEKIRYLQDMLETYIQKDIKSLIKEENIRAFNMMMYLLAENQGQVVSVSSLANEIGLTSRSVERYLDILEATYVMYPLLSYAKNIGNELKKSRKFYLYDLGIRNVILKDFRNKDREDLGSIYESFVYHQWHIALKPNQELKFWRNRQGLEIDFIFLENRVPTVIEVKSRASGIPNAFQTFFTHYPNTTRGIIYSAQKQAYKMLQDKEVAFKSFHEMFDPT